MPGPIRVPRPAATMTAEFMSEAREAQEILRLPKFNLFQLQEAEGTLQGFFSSSFLTASAGALAFNAFSTPSERSSDPPRRLVYTTTGV